MLTETTHTDVENASLAHTPGDTKKINGLVRHLINYRNTIHDVNKTKFTAKDRRNLKDPFVRAQRIKIVTDQLKQNSGGIPTTYLEDYADKVLTKLSKKHSAFRDKQTEAHMQAVDRVIDAVLAWQIFAYSKQTYCEDTGNVCYDLDNEMLKSSVTKKEMADALKVIGIRAKNIDDTSITVSEEENADAVVKLKMLTPIITNHHNDPVIALTTILKTGRLEEPTYTIDELIKILTDFKTVQNASDVIEQSHGEAYKRRSKENRPATKEQLNHYQNGDHFRLKAFPKTRPEAWNEQFNDNEGYKRFRAKPLGKAWRAVSTEKKAKEDIVEIPHHEWNNQGDANWNGSLTLKAQAA